MTHLPAKRSGVSLTIDFQ